jgi:hypothetical protein
MGLKLGTIDGWVGLGTLEELKLKEVVKGIVYHPGSPMPRLTY